MFDGGSGTEDDPYIIASLRALDNLRTNLADSNSWENVYFKQTEDIAIGDEGWAGIGTDTDKADKNKSFWGVYDGNGKKITNLQFSVIADGMGFFRSIAGNAIVKNLTVECVGTGWLGIDGTDTKLGDGIGAGIVCGYAGNYSRIEGCTSKGSLYTTKYAAGICRRQYVHCVIEGCSNEASISATSDKGCGGIVAHIQSGAGMAVIDCSNSGAIHSTAGQAGGIVGWNGCNDQEVVTVRNCTNTGVITTDTGVAAQIIAKGTNSKVEGSIIGNDSILFSALKAFDGLNFATVDGTTATGISNEFVVVGAAAPAPQYKVMSPIATLPVTLDTVGQTIAFDVALNEAFAAEITATGVGVETNLVEKLLTYTAIEAPTPGEDWPTDPTVDEGKDAKATFPNLPAAFEGADAGLVAAWAKKTGLAYADMADANIDAFLLDCAPEQVEAEKAKFVITKIEYVDDAWEITVADEFGKGARYGNGKVAIDDVTATFDSETIEATEAKGFFKATLVPFIIEK